MMLMQKDGEGLQFGLSDRLKQACERYCIFIELELGTISE